MSDGSVHGGQILEGRNINGLPAGVQEMLTSWATARSTCPLVAGEPDADCLSLLER
jgi:hypothetical protein